MKFTPRKKGGGETENVLKEGQFSGSFEVFSVPKGWAKKGAGFSLMGGGGG